MLPSQYRYVTDRNALILAVREVFEEGEFVVLDTETTGLRDTDEVIQIAIVDHTGAALLDTYVQTTKGRIPAKAQAIHGISKKDLKGAPRWEDVANQVREICRDKEVLSYNAKFDARLIAQTCRNHDTEPLNLTIACVMILWARFETVWDEWRGDWKWHKLPGGDHTALGDCRAALALLKRIAEADLEPVPEPTEDDLNPKRPRTSYDFEKDEEETREYLSRKEHSKISPLEGLESAFWSTAAIIGLCIFLLSRCGH